MQLFLRALLVKAVQSAGEFVDLGNFFNYYSVFQVIFFVFHGDFWAIPVPLYLPWIQYFHRSPAFLLSHH